jgi:hypothetical protein
MKEKSRTKTNRECYLWHTIDSSRNTFYADPWVELAMFLTLYASFMQRRYKRWD